MVAEEEDWGTAVAAIIAARSAAAQRPQQRVHCHVKAGRLDDLRQRDWRLPCAVTRLHEHEGRRSGLNGQATGGGGGGLDTEGMTANKGLGGDCTASCEDVAQEARGQAYRHWHREQMVVVCHAAAGQAPLRARLHAQEAQLCQRQRQQPARGACWVRSGVRSCCEALDRAAERAARQLHVQLLHCDLNA